MRYLIFLAGFITGVAGTLFLLRYFWARGMLKLARLMNAPPVLDESKVVSRLSIRFEEQPDGRIVGKFNR